MTTQQTTQETLGKRLGKYAFIISEIIAGFFCIAFIIDSIINKKINASLLNSILIYQGTVLTVTWGAKASSNFSNRYGMGMQHGYQIVNDKTGPTGPPPKSP